VTVLTTEVTVFWNWWYWWRWWWWCCML